MLSKFFGLAVAVVLLSACVSTGIKGEEADKYKVMLADKCFQAQWRDGDKVSGSKRKVRQEVVVFSIVKGKDNWKRIDISSEGVRDNIYHNTNSGEFVCGWRGWRAKNLGGVFSNI